MPRLVSVSALIFALPFLPGDLILFVKLSSVGNNFLSEKGKRESSREIKRNFACKSFFSRNSHYLIKTEVLKISDEGSFRKMKINIRD